MQTFLPFADFEESAAVLDRRRLNKQRVETLQIMSSLVLGTGWTNHPATKMWQGYLPALMGYQVAICQEWTGRGYRDNCYEKTWDLFELVRRNDDPIEMPFWFGNPELHDGYQSNLIRKDPDHYGPLFPGVPDDLPYYWPV